MKKLLPEAAVLVVAIAMLFLYFLPFFRLPVPGVAEPPCVPQGNFLAIECACTQRGVQSVGFPFRANLYDYCGQDDAGISWIHWLNIGTNVTILAGVYRVLKPKAVRK